MNRAHITHILRIAGAVSIQKLCSLLPLNSRSIVFYAHKRKGLCCNPKYILLELLKKYPKKYKLYWVSEYPDTVEKNRGYKVIRKRSVRYYVICSTAKVHITNDIVDETLLKRKKQIFINTWHGGGAFKKAGFDISVNKEEEELLHVWYDKIDYMLVSSQYLAEKFQQAFHLNTNQILKTGMPRSDVFFEKNDIYHKIRKKYGIEENAHIVLYAPTYRIGEYSLLTEQELLQVLTALNKRFGGKWLVMVRNHYFDSEEHFTYQSGKIINCNNFYDAQELLCGIDILITDFSSLLWDFSILQRPCFCIDTNPGKYVENERDFYISYEKWPYPKSKNVNELIEQIRLFDEELYCKKVKEFLDYLGSYDKGNSSERFVEILEELICTE